MPRYIYISEEYYGSEGVAISVYSMMAQLVPESANLTWSGDLVILST
jgi:hypothetical protein